MRYHVPGVGVCDLGDHNLIAAGGEGSVHAVSATRCVKIYHPGRPALPAAKIAELAVLDWPNIVKPEAVVTDERGAPAGYWMQRVRDPLFVPPLCSRDFRKRRRLRSAVIDHVAARLRDTVAHVLERRVLPVDINELNWLASQRYEELFAIDADAWLTPSFPATGATVIMDTIRDRQHAGFSVGTVWFATAVVLCQLYVGIHPYQGKHPDCHPPNLAARLEARMRGNLSIFRPGVALPPAAFGVAAAPQRLRRWFEEVFDQGSRAPAPAPCTWAAIVVPVTAVAPAPAPPPTTPAPGLDVLVVRCLPSDVIDTLATAAGTTVYLTETGVWVGDETTARAPPAADGAFLALTPGGRVLLAWLAQGEVVVADALDGRRPVLWRGPASAAAPAANGSVLLHHQGDLICELDWYEGGNHLTATPQPVAQVLPHATQLFAGVAIQHLLGACYVSLLEGNRQAPQLRIPELEHHQVVDARHAGGVLGVATIERGTGTAHRWWVRVSPTAVGYTIRRSPCAGAPAVNLVVTPAGVAVTLGDDDQVEVFRCEPDAAVVTLPGGRVDGSWRLFRHGPQVVAVRGPEVVRLSKRS